MKLYLKWFYWYKNFGDETILFGLLNYLQQEYNPESFVVEVWDIVRIQSRISKNKKHLDKWILDKLDFVENSIMSKRFRQLQIFLGLDKYRKFFKVFGGWEVMDESRKFPHDGRNLRILYHNDIRKRNFILIGGIGTDEKKLTKKIFKYILQKAKKIICREEVSYQRSQKYWAKSSLLYHDFSKNILLSTAESNNETIVSKEKNILINVSPKHFNPENLEKIEKFLLKYPEHKKIFFPADVNFDKDYYTEIRKILPELEIYDWTKHPLSDTISLFQSCDAWIGSRLHFLYPLKLFNKDFVSISKSDKIMKML